jgi:23S rRNA-/tRNA-specific pseudouridylate synthase
MGKKRWTVRAGDGPKVADVLVRMGDPSAAAEGRAYIGGRRVGPEDHAHAGDALEVWEAREAPKEDVVRVLARRGGLLIAFKPALIPTTPDRRGARSLISELEAELGAPVHPASRLDVGVSGAVLCALDEPARRHVDSLKREGLSKRVYIAIAGGPVSGTGTWDAPIGRGRGSGNRSIPVARGSGAEPAETRYAAIAHAKGARPGAPASTLLRLEPITGRMHQLRVHAAYAGAPLLGDREHGGARSITTAQGEVVSLPRIALHAHRVEVPDLRGDTFAASAPFPDDLATLWKKLDGDDAAWNELEQGDG